MLDNFADFSFTETAFSGYHSRTIVDKGQNTLKSIDRIYAELSAKGLGVNKLDNCFRGLHRFENGIIAHVDQVKPINDWPGKYLSDFIPLDLDNSEAAHLAVPDFRGMIEALYAKGLKIEESERYSICLTGLKGMETKIHAGAIGYEPEQDFAKIARRFVELLLPGKVGKNTWVDASIYQPARLTRIIGSFNAPKNEDEAEKTKEKIRGYKVELAWDEVASIVEKEAKLVYELWSKPNDRGIDEATVSGSRYWNCEPVPFLESLWQQAKETYREEKRTQVHGTSFAPLQVQSKFARHPACVSKLLQIIESGDVDNELSGTRHQAFLGLAVYASNVLSLANSPRAYEAYLRDFHEKLPEAKRLPETEFREIVRDGLKFSFSCGNKDSGTSLIKFCSGSCLQKVGSPNRRWETPLEMFPKVKGYFDHVNSPLKIGLRHIDEVMCGVDRKSMNIFIAAPAVGKTLIGLQSFLKMASVAKELDFVLPFISAEEQLSTLVSNVAVQTEKRNKRQIDRMMNDFGMPSFREWCEHHEHHVRFVDANVLTVKQVLKELEEIKHTSGKDMPVFYFDNLTFIKPDAKYITKGSNYAQVVAEELKELVFYANAAMIGTLHIPKDSAQQIRKMKDGTKYAQSVPELYSGMGSSYWANLGTAQWGLSRRGDFCMVNWTKGRKNMDGNYNVSKPFPLFVTPYYRALEYWEIAAMPEEEVKQQFPHLDMLEFEALDRGIDPLDASDDKPKRKQRESTLNYVE